MNRTSRRSAGRTRQQRYRLIISVFVWLICTSGVDASEHLEKRVIHLGETPITLTVSAQDSVDIQPGFEVEWYLISIADRARFRLLYIAVTTSPNGFVFSGHPHRTCIAGLHGLSESDGHDRTIVLRAPEWTGVSEVIAGFDDRDQAAWSILRSIAVSGRRGTCKNSATDSVLGKPLLRRAMAFGVRPPGDDVARLDAAADRVVVLSSMTAARVLLPGTIFLDGLRSSAGSSFA